MRLLYVTTIIFFTSGILCAQCYSGALNFNGPGCGCISGCDLTPYGGPNCGTGTTGNCTGGHIVSSIAFVLPDNCETQVFAQMQVRAGCTASGADSSPSPGDAIRVEGTTPKPWITGIANTSISDSFTQTGGIITVYGRANRADEIVTYQIYELSGPCILCMMLPVEFQSFRVSELQGIILLEWTTASELNNDYFTIEKSDDMVNWNSIKDLDGAGTSNAVNHYSAEISIQSFGTSYFRIRQTDFNGQFSFSPVVSYTRELDDPVIVVNDDGYATVLLPCEDCLEYFAISDVTGRMKRFNQSTDNEVQFNLFQGLNIISVGMNGRNLWTTKIFR